MFRARSRVTAALWTARGPSGAMWTPATPPALTWCPASGSPTTPGHTRRAPPPPPAPPSAPWPPPPLVTTRWSPSSGTTMARSSLVSPESRRLCRQTLCHTRSTLMQSNGYNLLMFLQHLYAANKTDIYLKGPEY